jgi:hypothetical protein
MRIDLLATLSAIALCIVPLSVRAEEEQRALGPHEHGHGTFNIAVEGNRILMELEAPGMDIVGFEHKARTEEQKTALEKASGELAKPLDLFRIPAAAGCSVEDVDVAVEAEHGHGHGHGSGKDPAKGEDDDHEDHEDHADVDHDGDGDEGHNAFHVRYALRCDDPSHLSSIVFTYFKTFAGARKLTVNLVTGKTQGTYEVSRAKPGLDLGGVM